MAADCCRIFRPTHVMVSPWPTTPKQCRCPQPRLRTPNTSGTVRELVLNELPGLRIDRSSIEAALDSGSGTRIPSRRAMVIIARVCKQLGVGTRAIKKSDLKPDQVTDVANLIELLASKTAPRLTLA